MLLKQIEEEEKLKDPSIRKLLIRIGVKGVVERLYNNQQMIDAATKSTGKHIKKLLL
jgi:hypothetical protein